MTLTDVGILGIMLVIAIVVIKGDKKWKDRD